MRKKYTPFLFLLFLLFLMSLFAGCGRANEEGTQSKPSPDQGMIQKPTETEVHDPSREMISLDLLSHSDNLSLLSAHLLGEGRLLLVYGDQESEIQREDITLQFKVFDLESKTFIGESEIYPNQFYFPSLCVLKSHFYLISDQTCFVFDSSCIPVKEFTVPEDTFFRYGPMKFWISDDLEKMVYESFGVLWISDLNGNNRQEIWKCSSDKPGIFNVFFPESSDCIGFYGGMITDINKQSEDCYGYINLSDFTHTVFVDDRTSAKIQGNIMLIQDKTEASGTPRDGVITTLNLETKERNQMIMDVASECENSYLCSDQKTIIGIHTDSDKNVQTYTVYISGEKVTSVGFPCDSEKELNRMQNAFIGADPKTKQIIFCVWNEELLCNRIESIPYEN